ncbi:MAG: PqqD family protein [Clostridia bacterium]|nr:PqqD family protein [Clostridia bacterium]
MKIKEGFILREVAGTFVIISTGDDNLDFKGVITVNEVGALIWRGVEAGKSTEEIVDKILSEYDVQRDVATVDCDEFLQQLIDKNIIEK